MADEENRPEGHGVAGLRTWDDKTFTWECACGERVTEDLPINEKMDPPAGDISLAAPGACPKAEQEAEA